MLAQIAPGVFAATLLAGCYNVPEPACGFVCGPSGECPANYRCNAVDNHCHRNDAPPSLVCAPPDAGIDAFVDVTPPTIVTRTPVPGAVDIPRDVIIRAAFSEPVTNVNLGTVHVLVDGEPIPSVVAYDFAESAMEIEPDTPLPFGVQATVRVLPGIADLAGNPLAPTEWSFWTEPDTEGPVVVTRSPLPDATDVSVDATITVTFDEPVLSVSSQNFSLRQFLIATTLDYDPVSLTAVLDPKLQLPAHTTYTVDVTGVQDLVGNVLQGSPVTWSFTTGADTVPPRVVENIPLDGSTGVPTTAQIWFSFDEPVTRVDASSFQVHVQGEPIAGTFLSADNDVSWRFRPSEPLPANTPITVKLSSGITDTATPPNALAPITITFTTGS